MKLYTKTGDDGSTGLFGGVRVGKDSLRVEAYGTVDELNASLGLALAAPGLDAFRDRLTAIQSRLFEVGADLATPYTEGEDVSKRYVPRLDPAAITDLEQAIDEASGQVEAMKCFVLPGGCDLAARMHICRTVCRRAERLTVALAKEEPVNEDVVVYLNRLSDLFFALSRLANKEAGVPDVPWISPRDQA